MGILFRAVLRCVGLPQLPILPVCCVLQNCRPELSTFGETDFLMIRKSDHQKRALRIAAGRVPILDFTTC